MSLRLTCVLCVQEGRPGPHFSHTNWVCGLACRREAHLLCLWHVATLVHASRTVADVICPACRSPPCRLNGRSEYMSLLTLDVEGWPLDGRSTALLGLLREWWERKGSAPLVIAGMGTPAFAEYHHLAILWRFLRSVWHRVCTRERTLCADKVAALLRRLLAAKAEVADVDESMRVLQSRRMKLCERMVRDVPPPPDIDRQVEQWIESPPRGGR